MARTVEDILDRAVNRSTANDTSLFGSGNPEILTRVDYAQQRLFARLASANRYFYVQAAAVNSSSGSSGRVLDLGAATPPAERVLIAKLPNGTVLNQVDLQDLEAELAPRYYPLGSTLVEVDHDWGAAGVVAVSVWYAYRPAALDLTGDLTQVVTVPDRFCDWLELDLALYMSEKDYGRVQTDPGEIERLTQAQTNVFQDFLGFLDAFPGPSSRRFVLPTPTVGEKA